MAKIEIEQFHGINILGGINTHPGSGTAVQHEEEYDIFQQVLSYVENKDNPVMIEVGSNWALWSLCFRHKFPTGKNILIELGKRQLLVGIKNFDLNGFSQQHYWGGVFLDDSGTFCNRENDLEYEKIEGEYFDDSIDGDIVGPQLDFIDIWSKEELDTVDILHMDIQGSELPLMHQLRESNLLSSVRTVVIATHSKSIHADIKNILLENGYSLTCESDYGTVGGDGMICATRNDGKRQ